MPFGQSWLFALLPLHIVKLQSPSVAAYCSLGSQHVLTCLPSLPPPPLKFFYRVGMGVGFLELGMQPVDHQPSADPAPLRQSFSELLFPNLFHQHGDRDAARRRHYHGGQRAGRLLSVTHAIFRLGGVGDRDFPNLFGARDVAVHYAVQNRRGVRSARLDLGAGARLKTRGGGEYTLPRAW